MVSPVAQLGGVKMLENRFDELKSLSHEALIYRLKEIAEEANLRKKEVRDEIDRRSKKERVILRIFVEYSLEWHIWITLVKGGGVYGFNEIDGFAGCSRWKLRAVLLELTAMELVKRVGLKYQAVSPDWFHV